MSPLTLTPNLPRPDEIYAALIAAHDGLTDEDSAALNARLILILANQIGDADILTEAFRLARAAAAHDTPAPTGAGHDPEICR